LDEELRKPVVNNFSSQDKQFWQYDADIDVFDLSDLNSLWINQKNPNRRVAQFPKASAGKSQASPRRILPPVKAYPRNMLKKRGINLSML
jgi:hypothetical protein